MVHGDDSNPGKLPSTGVGRKLPLTSSLEIIGNPDLDEVNICPLVNVYMTMERSTILNGNIHYKTYKWPCSIAMLSLPEGKNIQGPVFWAKIWVSCERSQITYRTCCFRLVGDKFSSIESSGQDLVVARCRLLGLGPRGFGGRRHLSLISKVKKESPRLVIGWKLRHSKARWRWGWGWWRRWRRRWRRRRRWRWWWTWTWKNSL